MLQASYTEHKGMLDGVIAHLSKHNFQGWQNMVQTQYLDHLLKVTILKDPYLAFYLPS